MSSTKRQRDKDVLEKTSALPSKKVKLDYQNLKPLHTLYVKNLNNKVNKKLLFHNLYLLFSAFGDIISIKLHRGYAFIIFAHLDSAKLALRSLQQEEFFEKPLVINFAINECKLITKTKAQEKEEKANEKGQDDDDKVLPSYE